MMHWNVFCFPLFLKRTSNKKRGGTRDVHAFFELLLMTAPRLHTQIYYFSLFPSNNCKNSFQTNILKNKNRTFYGQNRFLILKCDLHTHLDIHKWIFFIISFNVWIKDIFTPRPHDAGYTGRNVQMRVVYTWWCACTFWPEVA